MTDSSCANERDAQGSDGEARLEREVQMHISRLMDTSDQFHMGGDLATVGDRAEKALVAMGSAAQGPLLAHVSPSDPAARRVARVLGEIGNAEAIPFLLDCLARESPGSGLDNPSACVALAKLGQFSIPLFQEVFTDPSHESWDNIDARIVGEAYAYLEDSDMSVVLSRALASGKSRLQTAAASALTGLIRGDKCPESCSPLEMLEAGLDVRPDAAARQTIVAAITELRDPAAQDVLIQCLDDSDPDVRGWAARGLGWMRAETAFDALRTLARDDDSPSVREWAIYGLCFIDHRREARVDVLLAALNDPAPNVQALAADRLRGSNRDPRVREALVELETDARNQGNRALQEAAHNALQ